MSQPIVERATVESGGGGGGDDDDDPPIADRRPGRPLASVLRRFAVRAPLACGQEALTRDGLGVGSMVYGVRYRTVYGVRTFAVFSTCLIMERKKETIICAHVEL